MFGFDPEPLLSLRYEKDKFCLVSVEDCKVYCVAEGSGACWPSEACGSGRSSCLCYGDKRQDGVILTAIVRKCFSFTCTFFSSSLDGCIEKFLPPHCPSLICYETAFLFFGRLFYVPSTRVLSSSCGGNVKLTKWQVRLKKYI